ncbi:hypothetical protein, partial [Burkholderia ubonensis]|uniref:hypothetical protein n=1 Tax=Burkholderia ubonensis TaxID=101571 RepID=UPI001E4D3F58
MTLVIGHATKEIGFLIADTLLSSPAPLRGDEGPFNGVSHTFVSADVKMTHLAEVNLTHLGEARWRF